MTTHKHAAESEAVNESKGKKVVLESEHRVEDAPAAKAQPNDTGVQGPEVTSKAALAQEVDDQNSFLKFLDERLSEVAKELSLDSEAKNKLTRAVHEAVVDLIQKSIEEEQQHAQDLWYRLESIMKKNNSKDFLLMKRGLSWLDLEGLDDLASYVNFFEKMAILGGILSEDKHVSAASNHAVESTAEAKKERLKLMSDPQFLDSLTDKRHPKHKDSLSRLRNLNKVIVGLPNS